MKTTKIINFIFAAVPLLLLSTAAMAQTKKSRIYPMPGDTITDYTFTDLVNYPNRTAKISDFRGKWLILDFWGFTCSSCIASFPRMSVLSKQFKGQNVQLIMVGATKSSNDGKNYEEVTKKLFHRQDLIHHLKFTVAFDSLLYARMDVGSLPHIIVIDPNGVIKAKTNHVDSIQVAALLAGQSPKFERKFSMHELTGDDAYDKKVPLLTNNGALANGGNDTDYIYRSMLVPYDKSTMPNYSGRDFIGKYHALIDLSKPIKFELFGFPMDELLRLAYFGRSFWSRTNPEAYSSDYIKVLNETGNSIVDKELQKKYSYSLSMPAPDSIASLMRVLQEDLRRAFPYQARLETRSFPTYQITVADSVKLNSYLKEKKKEKQITSDPYDGVWKVKNMNFDIFMNAIIAYMHVDSPVFNKIGVQNKSIDLDFQSDLQGKESIINGMEEMGLKVDLIHKPMRVLVLR